MKKSILVTIATLMMLVSLVFAGCTAEKAATDETATDLAQAETEVTAEEAGEITIGFIPMTLNNEYFITMIKGAQQKADELGITLEVQGAQEHARAA